MCNSPTVLEDFGSYLEPTGIIDSDHPEVRAFARRVAGAERDPVEVAIRLYLSVRDSIRYDPYMPFSRPEHYRASLVLAAGRGFCIPKASLLCAVARACGLPCRVGFADVVNHLATRQLLEMLGSNRFVFHSFVEFHLEGKWVKATPAFNKELCERHGVEPLEFNGREDSLFQAFNRNSEQFMEYVDFHGTFADVPVHLIVDAWEKEYGKERMALWKQAFQRRNAQMPRVFEEEDVWKE